ncbi:MAG: HNH endonuclease [Phycisphaerae bacterium]|nr:HNH endonuclease [Phycisphaerae bacterium]
MAERPWRKLYCTKAWAKLRQATLVRDGFTCQWPGCGKLLTGSHHQHNAPVVHHKTDHKGDRTLFFDPGNLESLCKEHHDQDAQRQTHRGYVSGHDADGRPLDPDHPWSR